MRLRRAGLASLITALSLGLQWPVSAAPIGTLVHTTQTSTWTPPSPDPMGITFDSATGHLILVDSEVDEMALFAGNNVFEATVGGSFVRAGAATAYTVEPTGITVDAANDTYYVCDDDTDRINVVNDGPDDMVGTADDVVTFFSTRPFGSNDIGDIAFVAGDLYWTDGIQQEVYQLDAGTNGVFDGHPTKGGDDVLVNHFDVGAVGQPDPEGIGYNAGRGTISVISDLRRSPIAEFTPGGSYVGDIDLAAVDVRHPSGIVFAASSDNASTTSAYITDRGVDNNFDPAENDGKIWEVRLSVDSNSAPQVTNPGAQDSGEGESVNLQIQATDADLDPLSYVADNLPDGLSIGAGTGLITGTVATGAAAGSPYSVTVTVSDGQALSPVTFEWTVGDAPPAAPTGLKIVATTRGLSLDWANNSETDLAGYKVARSAAPGGPYTDLTLTPIAPSAYLDKTAPANATSYYRVTAVDDGSHASAPIQRSARRGTIVFHGSSKLAKRSTSLDIAKPAGALEGDVLVASIAVRGGTITPPVGWTLVATRANGTELREAVYIHVVGASEPGVYQFAFPTQRPAAGVITAYGGVNSATPIDGFGSLAGASSLQIKAPSVATTVAEAVLIGGFSTAIDGNVTPPAGMLETAEAVLKFGIKRVAVEQSDQVRQVAGNTGAKTATATKAAINVGITVVLRPA